MCMLSIGPETVSQNLGMQASSRSCFWCSDNTERATIPQVNLLSAAQTTGRIMTGKECMKNWEQPHSTRVCLRSDVSQTMSELIVNVQRG